MTVNPYKVSFKTANYIGQMNGHRRFIVTANDSIQILLNRTTPCMVYSIESDLIMFANRLDKLPETKPHKHLYAFDTVTGMHVNLIEYNKQIKDK